jgi:hypothetical protein
MSEPTAKELLEWMDGEIEDISKRLETANNFGWPDRIETEKYYHHIFTALRRIVVEHEAERARVKRLRDAIIKLLAVGNVGTEWVMARRFAESALAETGDGQPERVEAISEELHA